MCELLLEVVTAVCGLILPRLILSHFGSAYNGITSSISQFISCIALLKSGIGSVTRAALYKPLAEKDSNRISEVVNATEQFMRRIALIFAMFIVGFAALYPFLVSNEFSWLFSFTLVLILSIHTVAQYFFGLTYQMVIQADQNNYIISLVSIATIIINCIIAAQLILAGCGIHIVKLGSAIVFLFPPIFYLIYVRKKYRINKKIPANKSLIGQRWDAFGHQLANFINNNTDIIVTTIILGVKEVSVYAVFYMVAGNLKKVVNSVSSGTTAAFGNMIAKGEMDNVRSRLRQYELLVFSLCTILFTTSAIMYIPFLKLYTKGVTDVNYLRYGLAVLFSVAEFFACTKIVYETVVYAAGQFKQTKMMAFFEAAINISVSVVLAFFIGLNGILIGTLVAGLFRTIVYNYFVSKKIVKRSPFEIVPKLLISALCFFSCFIICKLIPLNNVTNYFQWAGFATIVLVVATLFTIGLCALFFRNDLKGLGGMLKGILRKKR